MGDFDLVKKCIVGGDQEEADREELADRGSNMTGAEMTDTEVPVSEIAPCLVPGRQCAGWVDRRWQVQGGGGSSGAATVEASEGVDDACTSLSVADIGRSSLAAEVEFGAE